MTRRALLVLILSIAAGTTLQAQSGIPVVRYMPCPIKDWILWVGDGADFEKTSYLNDVIFDPAVAMPHQTVPGKAVEWIPTPKNYQVNDEYILQKDGHGGLERVTYSFKDDAGHLFQPVTLFLWDTHLFCIVFGGSDPGNYGASFTYTMLEDTSHGTELEISLHLSGTGAFRVSNRFSFATDRPVLIRKTEAGRGFSKDIPVDQPSSFSND
jgi:hypothetical protein